MLQETADRVGAGSAMLIGPGGALHACSGMSDRFDAEATAAVIHAAVRLNEFEHDGSALGAYVSASVQRQGARAYVRRIESGWLLATVFVLDEASPSLVRVGREPELPPRRTGLPLRGSRR